MKRVRASIGAASRSVWLARNARWFEDKGPRRRPRLLVDVSVIMRHDAATGIQRVVRSVWWQLSRLNSAEFDVVPVHAGRSYGYCYAPDNFIEGGKPGRVPVGVKPGDRFLGLDLSAHYVPNLEEQLAHWRRAGATLHFVVYDLLPLSRPEWFEPATSHNFSRWFDTLRRHADQALCISNSVSEEVVKRTIGIPANQRLKVGRLFLSGDIAGSLPSAGLCEGVKVVLDRAQSHPTVLMVGTVEPRKGYDKAIDAFEHLWAKDVDSPQLVIIGKPGWKTSALQDRLRNHPQSGNKLHWLEDVSDEALTRFYSASRAVMLASYDEGFGLPVVEAASHRRWTLVRDLPVFREQNLPNALYFSDDAPEALAADIRNLVDVATSGPPSEARLPSWRWCVEQLIAEMTGLCDGPSQLASPRLRVVS